MRLTFAGGTGCEPVDGYVVEGRGEVELQLPEACTGAGVQLNATFGVVVIHDAEGDGGADPDRQLLPEFPPHAIGGSLVRVAFAAWKFPQPAQHAV